MGRPHNTERDRLIFERLSRKEITPVALARQFSIHPVRVRDIFKREKDKAERADRGLGSLDRTCYSIIATVLDSHFTLTDLRRFVEENPDWRLKFRHTGRCGERRLGLIKQFMMDNGIITEKHGPASHARPGKGTRNAPRLSSATLAGLKRFVEENPDWEKHLGNSSGCEKRALELIKQVLADTGAAR
ncbi:hypothetical protein H0O00_01735 [Candidatus Micrarchaeota archaeon]|nr:hypothetical protein [Candidatus Micrarchaeota archaeon]